MNNSEYYNIEFTPAIGCYYLNVVFGEYSLNESIPLYKFFLIFPLLNDTCFLNYIIRRKRTHSLSKLIIDYTHEQKSNHFWIEYNTKYFSLRKYCFESIFLGISVSAFKLSKSGIQITRFLSKEIPVKSNTQISAMKKLGEMTKNMEYNELLRIMKVGE